jgi:Flp pilus assembly protein TadB
MTVLFAALGIGILSYIGFVFLFPKALPSENADYMRQALDRIYEENRQAKNDQIAIMRDQLKEEGPLVRLILGANIMRPLYEAALQAGYQNDLKKILFIMAGAFFVVSLLGYQLGFGFLGMIVAVPLAIYVPYRHCQKCIRKRNRKFIDLFPDALDMIVRLRPQPAASAVAPRLTHQ